MLKCEPHFVKFDKNFFKGRDMENTIICSKCGASIEVTEALSAQLSSKIRSELEGQIKSQKTEVEKERTKLRKQQTELEEAKEAVAKQVKDGIALERAKLEAAAKKKAMEEMSAELEERAEQLAETKKKLKKAQDEEIALRKRERELQSKSEELELTVSRTLDAERDKIRLAAKKQVTDEHQLKDAEKEKQIGDMRKQIEELKRKAEQGSQQLQGEVLELELEQILSRAFPTDTIEAVPKGVHGGDVLHRVRDTDGSDCGAILWESKRTTRWDDKWLAKLRDDQRAAKAASCAMVTVAMPKDCTSFTSIAGVWVSNRDCVHGVATALRLGLIEVARVKRASEGQHGKMEVLYNYLSGAEFKNRITGVAESFISMRKDLEDEKRVIQKTWAKREKQLERAVTGTAGLYGDLQGIMGKRLAEVESLEMPALEAVPADDQESN